MNLRVEFVRLMERMKSCRSYPLPVGPHNLKEDKSKKRTKQTKKITTYRVYRTQLLYTMQYYDITYPEAEAELEVFISTMYGEEDQKVKETCKLIADEANEMNKMNDMNDTITKRKYHDVTSKNNSGNKSGKQFIPSVLVLCLGFIFAPFAFIKMYISETVKIIKQHLMAKNHDVPSKNNSGNKSGKQFIPLVLVLCFVFIFAPFAFIMIYISETVKIIKHLGMRQPTNKEQSEEGKEKSGERGRKGEDGKGKCKKGKEEAKKKEVGKATKL